MLDFWLSAGLLLLAALAFLLLPALRGRRARPVEDRTALNVSLYQERLAELTNQHAAGILDDQQLSAGEAEAARELLADADQAGTPASSRLGRAVPLLVALLVPLCALGLYLHWGGSQQVEVARALADAPRSIEEMTARLEQAVQVQPDSAEGWYYLGRTYMAQNRAADAASAFERTAQLAGRPPEVLGQWAQALFFANDRHWSEHLQQLTDEALQRDPQEGTSLGLLGIVAFEQARYADAITYWQRLVAGLPAGDSARSAIESGIDKAKARLLEAGGTLPSPAALPAAAQVRVRVALADALRDKVQPGDSLFVFARASEGPPMPLAVKRLTVADLPVEVSLSDADAMMPQLKISAFPQIQLVARISRAGNATAGEWVGRSQPLASDTRELQQLLIDSPDQ